jgi:hypothetical protein
MIGPRLKSFRIDYLRFAGEDRVSNRSFTRLFERLESLNSLTNIDIANFRSKIPIIDMVARMSSLHGLQLYRSVLDFDDVDSELGTYFSLIHTSFAPSSFSEAFVKSQSSSPPI